MSISHLKTLVFHHASLITDTETALMDSLECCGAYGILGLLLQWLPKSQLDFKDAENLLDAMCHNDAPKFYVDELLSRVRGLTPSVQQIEMYMQLSTLPSQNKKWFSKKLLKHATDATKQELLLSGSLIAFEQCILHFRKYFSANGCMQALMQRIARLGARGGEVNRILKELSRVLLQSDLQFTIPVDLRLFDLRHNMLPKIFDSLIIDTCPCVFILLLENNISVSYLLKMHIHHCDHDDCPSLRNKHFFLRSHVSTKKYLDALEELQEKGRMTTCLACEFPYRRITSFEQDSSATDFYLALWETPSFPSFESQPCYQYLENLFELHLDFLLVRKRSLRSISQARQERIFHYCIASKNEDAFRALRMNHWIMPPNAVECAFAFNNGFAIRTLLSEGYFLDPQCSTVLDFKKHSCAWLQEILADVLRGHLNRCLPFPPEIQRLIVRFAPLLL
jgi:hypothetical protein